MALRRETYNFRRVVTIFQKIFVMGHFQGLLLKHELETKAQFQLFSNDFIIGLFVLLQVKVVFSKFQGLFKEKLIRIWKNC